MMAAAWGRQGLGENSAAGGPGGRWGGVGRAAPRGRRATTAGMREVLTDLGFSFEDRGELLVASLPMR